MNCKWQICIAKEPQSLLLGSMAQMKHEILPIGEHELSDPAHLDPEIELLARETQMPPELVAKVYSRERAKLERTARIKTYVPVLAHRQVKALLRGN
jgi:hypothetical protein